MVERVLLLGGGGHGAVVLDTLLGMAIAVHGVLDPARAAGSAVLGVPVLGGDEWLAAENPAGILLANGVGAQPRSRTRQGIFEKWKGAGFRFVTVVHRSSVIGREAALGEGAQVMAGAVLQCRTVVGDNATVNTRASLDHDVRVGAHAFIGPGAVLCGEVDVARSAFIGANATILPGIRVGEGAVVGAGAVVTRDVPDGRYAVGNPARLEGGLE